MFTHRKPSFVIFVLFLASNNMSALLTLNTHAFHTIIVIKPCKSHSRFSFQLHISVHLLNYKSFKGHTMLTIFKLVFYLLICHLLVSFVDLGAVG